MVHILLRTHHYSRIGTSSQPNDSHSSSSDTPVAASALVRRHESGTQKEFSFLESLTITSLFDLLAFSAFCRAPCETNQIRSARLVQEFTVLFRVRPGRMVACNDAKPTMRFCGGPLRNCPRLESQCASLSRECFIARRLSVILFIVNSSRGKSF